MVIIYTVEQKCKFRRDEAASSLFLGVVYETENRKEYSKAPENYSGPK